MSLTLGEKLRQAREERGFSISEIAEQTRISSQYLQSIEEDDYRTLPGGIFNKGFVKSYAKLVGVDEQEALADYAALVTENAGNGEADLKPYRPEVLTDDRSSASMIPTIILAVVMLGLMSAGLLFLVDYLRRPAAEPAANDQKAATNTASNSPINTNVETGRSNAPEMTSVKVEFKALSVPVSLSATLDGKLDSNLVNPGSAVNFEPKESLKLSYSKSLAQVVEMTINGKSISLPAQPLVARRNSIEFEINKENIEQIWMTGAISTEIRPAAETFTNANIANSPTVATPAVTPPRSTPSPRPSAPARATPDDKPAATPRQALPGAAANRP